MFDIISNRLTNKGNTMNSTFYGDNDSPVPPKPPKPAKI